MGRPKNKQIVAAGDDNQTELDEFIDDRLEAKNPVDVKQALTLRLQNKLSYGKIAELLNCPKSSVHYHLKPFERLISDPTSVDGYFDNKATLLSAVEFNLAKELLDKDKLKSASINNIAYAFNTVAQQGHLARGEATQNIQYHVLSQSVEEMDKDLERLERELGEN